MKTRKENDAEELAEMRDAMVQLNILVPVKVKKQLKSASAIAGSKMQEFAAEMLMEAIEDWKKRTGVRLSFKQPICHPESALAA